MGLVSGITVFVIVWWTVLFMVLPWGVRPETEGQAGHQHGAPKNARIAVKFLVTTGIAIVLWLAIDALVLSDLISFRDMARQLP
jgi:predicted secreted protein